MSSDPLDELDYGILQLLQQDARHTTPIDMADRLPVTDTTVRNRIEKMEERGIIKGFTPRIDYEKAGFPLRVEFTCTAPVQERATLAEEALELSHVVQVEEMLSAYGNIQILVVTNEAEELNTVTSQIDALGLTIEQEKLLRRIHSRPFNHFGSEVVTEEE